MATTTLPATDGTSGWWIEDRNSTNGVFVNDLKVKHARLHEGDVITFGGVHATALPVGGRLVQPLSEFVYTFQNYSPGTLMAASPSDTVAAAAAAAAAARLQVEQELKQQFAREKEQSDAEKEQLLRELQRQLEHERAGRQRDEEEREAMRARVRELQEEAERQQAEALAELQRKQHEAERKIQGRQACQDRELERDLHTDDCVFVAQSSPPSQKQRTMPRFSNCANSAIVGRRRRKERRVWHRTYVVPASDTINQSCWRHLDLDLDLELTLRTAARGRVRLRHLQRADHVCNDAALLAFLLLRLHRDMVRGNTFSLSLVPIGWTFRLIDRLDRFCAG